MPADTACKLKPTPADPTCAFKATAGDKVTLQVTPAADGGLIEFQSATYGGTAIPGTPATTITFTVLAGTNDLIVVYNFTHPKDGHGQLHEVCSQNTLLGSVRAVAKTVDYTICA